MFENPSDARILEILTKPRRVAVVGCSPDPNRDSHRIAKLLLDRGHRIFPVNPRGGQILGRPVARSLTSLTEPIDVVDVFRRPQALPEVVTDSITIGAKILWLQLGVVDDAEAIRATAAGLTVVMDRCPAIEYRRLFSSRQP